MAYNNELLRYATEHSQRIEQEPVKGQSFDNHWRVTLLARTAANVHQLLHPRVVHQLLYEGLPMPANLRHLGLQAGDYRPVGVNAYVVGQDSRNHMFADSLEVPALMRAWWAQWWESWAYSSPDSKDDLVRWWFHAWFEAIHPFVDGNGRVGRVLWWNMAMVAGKSIEIVAFEERQFYYDRLESWRRDYCNVEHMNPFK